MRVDLGCPLKCSPSVPQRVADASLRWRMQYAKVARLRIGRKSKYLATESVLPDATSGIGIGNRVGFGLATEFNPQDP